MNWSKLFFTLLCLLSFGNVRAAVILQYHHISDDTPTATSTSPQVFAEHLEYLHGNNFYVMSLPAMLAALRQGETLPPKAVAITFDDSYRSIYATAFPLLEKYQFPFTVFINTDPVGLGGEFLEWREIVEMAEAGAVIANHTHSHPHLVRKAEGETDADWRQRIREEILHAERIIEKHTGQSHQLLAYPYGEYNAELVDLLKTLDFVGIGQHSGAIDVHADWHRVPRFPMGGHYGNMRDFPLKAAALALPIAQQQRATATGEPLADMTVRAGDRPQLTLWLRDASIAEHVQCYFLGEPMNITIEKTRVTVRAEQSLQPGRTRYNCTARDADTGRYYWFSQPWLVQDENGKWQHSD